MTSPIQGPGRPNPAVRPPIVATPSVEQYIQHSLKHGMKIRNLEAMVMLHGLVRDDGKMDPADKKALKEALVKRQADILPEAAKLMRQAAGLEKGKERIAYDAMLVREYLGYVAGGKVNGGEADYVLTTARNIGGSKAVKSFLAAQLKNHPEKFEPEAVAKFRAFIKEGGPAVGPKGSAVKKSNDSFA